MSTFLEMRTMLQALGYGTDSATVQGLFINEAVRRISRRRAWSWMRSSATVVLTPGQIEYTWANLGISPAPRRLESARLIETAATPPGVWPLKWLSPQGFNDRRGAPATTWPASERELPSYWSRPTSAGIAVWWPPDLAYTLQLNYFATATALVADGDAPPGPPDYHDVYVYEAAWLMASRQRDQVMLTEMRAERDAVLAQLEAEESVAQMHDYERIGGKEIWTGMERRF